MRVDKFTTKTREALVAAQQIASERGQSEIHPEAILLALLQQEGGIAAAILRKVNNDISPEAVAGKLIRFLDEQLQGGGGVDVVDHRSPRRSPRISTVDGP